MDGLTEGRMVHYVLPQLGNRSPGEHRAAVVVKVWRVGVDGLVNLHVLTDGTNDSVDGAGTDGGLWLTSVHYDPACEPRTWHWIEKA